MGCTAADSLVETLQDWGVNVVFGIPGDGINGIMEALRKKQAEVRFIQVRHEESAALMACAWAKYTGRLGCCLGTSGPGGIHLLNGLYDAKLDGAPVIAITGHHYHDLIDTHAQQDVSLERVFADVAVYNTRVMGPEHLPHVAELACREAVSRRGVSHLNIPLDFQGMECKAARPSKRGRSYQTGDAPPRPAHFLARADLEAAAAILNEGKKIAIMAGRGALGTEPLLIELAERLGAPVIKPLLGKAVVPDDSPYTTGGIGLLGTLPSQQALEECDTLLLLGTSFPYIEFYPKPVQARAVQVDIDPGRLGLRYPIEVGLVADVRSVLETLLPLLQRHEDRSFLTQSQERMKQWRELMERRGTSRDMPMKPQVVAHELNLRLADDAVVSCDSGTVATWFARHLQARGRQMYSLSGTLATMANGLPYTIAAQLAYPDRQCVAFVGDGGFAMLMAEFATAVRYQLPIKVVVIKNNTLGMIKWEQMVFEGNPEYGCELHPIDFAAIARACGGTGYTVEAPWQCGPLLEKALATPGPVLIEAVVDPLEPPMPPKTTLDQELHFAKALARGEPNRAKIVATVVRDRVRELV